MNRLRAQHGATLGEVLTGVILFSILVGAAAMALPALIGGPDLKGAAREVYGELSNARMSAVAAGVHYRFVIGGDRLYKLHADRDSDGAIDEGETVKTKLLGDGRGGVSFTSSDGIVFAPDGTASSYGNVVVANRNGEHRTIVVNASGHVRIQ